MTFFQRLFLIALGCVLADVSYAGKFERKEVAADAKWVIHVDFDQLRTSQLGQQALALPLDERAQRKLNSIKVLFDFDLQKDLKSLTAYGSQVDSDMGRGVAIVKAKYNKKKILAVLQLGDGFTSIKVGAHELIRLPQNQNIIGDKSPIKKKLKESAWCVFFDAGTIVYASRKEGLLKAIDVLEGKLDNLTQRNTFAHLDELEKSSFFFATANLAELGDVNPQAKMLREAKSIALCLRESQAKDGEAQLQLQAFVEGKSAENGRRIRRSIDGLVALAQMHLDSKPDLKDLVGILDGVEITRKDKLVTIDFACGLSKLLGAVRKLKEHKIHADRSGQIPK